MRYLATVLLIICGCSLFTACEVKLEREGIPTWLGIQLEADAACSPDSWLANQAMQEQYKPTGWTVEVPIFLPENDSSTMRVSSAEDIILGLNQLKSLSTQTCLHFSMQNPYRLRSDQIQFITYTSLISDLLNALPYSPDKLMFSGFWIQEEAFQQALLSNFASWQKQHTTSRFYLAGRHQVLLSDKIDWEGKYDLAVIHDAPPDEMYKPHFRKINQGLSAKSRQFNKPLFIAQTNILGDNKLLLFKNQLRFWDKEMVIEGLTINSLYCKSSLADSTTRFGLAKDQTLLDYIEKLKK